MKKLTLFATLIVLSLSVLANEPKKAKNYSPQVYLTMKKGKLFEFDHGKTKLVKKDITLVNMTTIHPNGAIDASSGQSLQLKEGQYMTMDGRIRNLNEMYHAPKARKKVVKKKPVVKKCQCEQKKAAEEEKAAEEKKAAEDKKQQKPDPKAVDQKAAAQRSDAQKSDDTKCSTAKAPAQKKC